MDLDLYQYEGLHYMLHKSEFVSDGCHTSFPSIQKGNIFLCDYKGMDGLPDKHQLVTAGLCLLYMNSENKLMPIAIQVVLSLMLKRK